MAKNRTTYEQSLDIWQERVDDGCVSIAPELGAVAILLPYVGGAEYQREEVEQLPSLKTEAYALADRLYARGRETVIAINAEPEDFKRVLTDPSISDVTVIGHGCLASVEVVSPETKNRLDWYDLAHMADHLKSGSFAQRVCGILPRKLNVPIGLMVVSDHRSVQAIVGRRVGLAEISQLAGDVLPSVTNLARMSYDDVKAAFPQRDQ